jgi:hypothetical protein
MDAMLLRGPGRSVGPERLELVAEELVQAAAVLAFEGGNLYALASL